MIKQRMIKIILIHKNKFFKTNQERFLMLIKLIFLIEILEKSFLKLNLATSSFKITKNKYLMPCKMRIFLKNLKTTLRELLLRWERTKKNKKFWVKRNLRMLRFNNKINQLMINLVNLLNMHNSLFKLMIVNKISCL